MKATDLSKVLSLIPGTHSMLILKHKDAHGLGVINAIQNACFNNWHQEMCCLPLDSETLIKDLKKHFESYKDRNMCFIFDFTNGICTKENKEALLPLLIHRHNNEFELPENAHIVIHDFVEQEPEEFTLENIDYCAFDKLWVCTVEEG